MKEQNHPLYANDRDIVDRLMGVNSPNNREIVDLARLFLRYDGFPGAFDLQDDLRKILKLWNISKTILNEKAKEIWQSGYRPGMNDDLVVGSGFDTSDD